MKLLLYCTKQPHKLYSTDKGYVITDFELGDYYKTKEKLNGKIVAECDFEVEEITIGRSYGFNPNICIISTKNLQPIELLSKSCFEDYDDLFKYLKYDFDNDYGQHKKPYGYAIHIKNLHIFDKSKELSDYRTFITDIDRLREFAYVKNFDVVSVRLDEYLGEMKSSKTLEKTPQNMQKIIKYIGDNEYEYAILISIRPEWLCKILNREKTIEVRKRVLKEMLK